MKALAAALVLLSSKCFCCAIDQDNITSTALRGKLHTEQRRILRPKHACTIVRVETQYEDSAEEISMAPKDEFKCKLHPEDREEAGSLFVSIEGVDSVQLSDAWSGETTLEAEGAFVSNGVLSVPSGASIQFGTNENRRRLNKSEGTKKILVVRATSGGGDTIANKDDLADRIFGIHGNPINMRSQYLGCSHNKLDMAPFEGETQKGYIVTNGVIEVSIRNDYRGQSRYSLEDAVEYAASKLVGDLESQFDHVMLCLPPGSSGGWLAYAYVNSFLSAFNDRWCEKLSTSVHELGHNLNLAHSGTDQGSYFDKHCVMGYSFDEFDGPLMCFNPAKSWHLGWYEDQSIEWDPSKGTFVGTLVGVDGYGRNKDDIVIIKIAESSTSNLFIGYNRATGQNQGTRMAKNLVTIVKQGNGYSQSYYLAGLEPGISYTISSFGRTGKDLTITFLNRGSSLDEAKVAISHDDCIFPSCCEGSMCEDPTVSPSLDPTVSPSPKPTTVSPIADTLSATQNPTPIVVHDTTQIPMIYQFSGTGTQQLLLRENFSDGLGIFSAFGNTVTVKTEDGMDGVNFELQNDLNPPGIYAEIDVTGSTIISVFFYFKASWLHSDQDILVQYSADDRNTWNPIKVLKFGDGEAYAFNEWYRVMDALFVIPEGTDTITIEILGRAGNNELDDESTILMDTRDKKSELFIGGFVCLGDRQRK